MEGFTQRELSATDVIRRYLDTYEANKLLNVGMNLVGKKQNHQDHWWQRICKANDIEPHVLEIFPENVKRLEACGVPNIKCGDVMELRELGYDDAFDIILWWHGPEHMDKDDSRYAIREIEGEVNPNGLVLLGSPLGFEKQGTAYGNKHEQHLSAWSESNYKDLEYHTEIVDDTPKRPTPHITAWKVMP
jgi:hypothetical protein